MIAVCLPSRGLIHSRTVEAVLNEVLGSQRRYGLLLTHDLPIPDCFNDLTERALLAGASHLLFVEEDMIIPPGIFSTLLTSTDDIVTLDYPVVESSPTPVVQNIGGYTLAGTGITLIKREVFEKLGKPYWQTPARDATTLKVLDQPNQYGGHDIDFCVRAQDAGFHITVLPEKAGQYRVVEHGKYETNAGSHNITEMYL